MATELSIKIRERRKIADQAASLPIETIEDLRKAHYLSLTLPKKNMEEKHYPYMNSYYCKKS